MKKFISRTRACQLLGVDSLAFDYKWRREANGAAYAAIIESVSLIRDGYVVADSGEVEVDRTAWCDYDFERSWWWAPKGTTYKNLKDLTWDGPGSVMADEKVREMNSRGETLERVEAELANPKIYDWYVDEEDEDEDENEGLHGGLASLHKGRKW